MLEMKPACEKCGADIAGKAAYICSYECTFCPACTASPLAGRCPNCQGALLPRPARVKVPELSAMPACDTSLPFTEREVRQLGVAQLGGWQVKRYSIRELSRTASGPADWAAAEQLAAAVLNQQASGGAAFVILHNGRDGDYLLIDWWSDQTNLNHRLYLRPPGETSFRDMRHTTWMACVWELLVIAVEHKAWMESAMGRGSLDAYATANVMV